MIENQRPSSGGRVKFIQVNLNKQAAAHDTALQIALETQTDILLLQEPYCPRNYQTDRYIGLQHSAYYLLTPQPTSSYANIREKPRVLAYIRKAARLEFSPRYDLANDPDLQIIEVIGEEPFLVVNVYNERQRLQSGGLGLTTVERLLQHLTLCQPAIIAGDFNLHHPWWNSTANPQRTSKAETLVRWLQKYRATLLVDSEETAEKGGTFVRSNLTTTSIIDLAFYTTFQKVVWKNWRYIEPTGSDHETIAFEACSLRTETLEQLLPSYNCKKADWEAFSAKLQAGEDHLIEAIEEAASIGDLDLVADLLIGAIRSATEGSIPKKRTSEHSKPWWTPELKDLRKAQSTAQRIYKKQRTPALAEAYKAARNAYNHAIRTAKQECWVSYLEGLQNQEVFSALRYTRDRSLEKVPNLVAQSGLEATTFREKCDTLITTLFPTTATTTAATSSVSSRPQNLTSTGSKATANTASSATWKWPGLTEIEVEKAILSSSAKKAAGPDRISFAILHHAYKAIPTAFFRAYKALFDAGCHPRQWKQAIGIVLAKPNKENYSLPKSYRIIALLNCLGKVLEKVLATRLSYLANTTSLLHPSQIGGRKQRSAIDAALLLLNEIQSQKEARKRGSNTVTTALFLDIKGAFDYVSKPQLLLVLKKLGLPSNLISWVSSFLTDRSIQLAFDGQIQPTTSIEVGIPQGSPISPVLFLIYVRDIVVQEADLAFQISFMDDFGLTATSTSAARNCRQLERVVQRLLLGAEEQAVQFEPAKTELIHFTTKRETPANSISVGGYTIEPKPVVRWLGIWFDSKLTFKAHIEKKINSATAAYFGIQRLGNTQKGLGARALRLLYTACVTSIADYGVQLWWKGDGGKQGSLIRPYQRLQNLAATRITGAFKGSPQRALELEAGLLPPNVRFEKACMGYSLRTLLFQYTHPVTEAITRPVRDELAGEESDTALRSYLLPNGRLQLQALACRANSLILRNWNIEKIKSQWAAPWASRLPPNTTISITKSSKKEAKTEHKALLQKLANDPFTERITVYTDGSQGEVEGAKTNAAGACILRGRTVQRAGSWNLGSKIEVADAEVVALIKALQLTQSIPLGEREETYIFCDSQAAIQKIQGGYSYYAFKVRHLLARFPGRIYIYWVPSHVGVFGNELADKLAKRGLTETPNAADIFTSVSHLRRLAKAKTSVQWKASWLQEAEKGYRAKGLGTHYQRVCQDSLNFRPSLYTIALPRRHQSAYTQLKLGIGFLKAYQRLIGKASDNLCSRCSRGKETTTHLVLYCSEYAIERQRLRKALRGQLLSLQTLFCTKSGREALEAYLISTRICTAEWFLETLA
jgi:ribonuclease HI/exonuclease III